MNFKKIYIFETTTRFAEKFTFVGEMAHLWLWYNCKNLTETFRSIEGQVTSSHTHLNTRISKLMNDSTKGICSVFLDVVSDVVELPLHVLEVLLVVLGLIIQVLQLKQKKIIVRYFRIGFEGYLL